jgi:Spy/CpxP family protein refolding chaperone
MAKALGLNADQEARIEQLMLARQQEAAALKAKYGTDKKAGRADLQAARDRYQAQLKTILTAEQYAKFNQLKEEHRGAGKAKAKA